MEGITMDRLFRAVKEVELAGTKLRVRALSDLEIQLRYRAALLSKMKVLQALKNETTDEYKVVFLPLEEATDDQLRATLFALKRRDFVMEVENETPVPYIPFPDKATKEEEIEVLEQREKAIQDTNTVRLDSVKVKLEKYREVLTGTEREKLLPQARKVVAENYSEGFFQDEYLNQSLHMALDGQMSMEDVKGLSRQAQSVLMQAFVEVNDVDPLKLIGSSAMVLPTDSSPLSSTVDKPS